uniref:Uncharacterized protein n=1 Tax=Cyclophora tenuis TaxID=216820 RepID=A0A7S1D7J6_CYCTE
MSARREREIRENRRQSTAEWFAKSMGFVDTLCCYSYSKEQVDDEAETLEVDHGPRLVAPTWMYEDLDGDSIVATKKPPSRTVHSKLSPSRRDGSLYCDWGYSPAKSVSTASTVTTSTTTTVRTSTRSPAQTISSTSSDRDRSRQFESHKAPREISLPSSPEFKQPRRPIQMRQVPSNALPGVPFYSSTEGYQCR